VVATLAPLIITAAPPAWPTLHGRAINCSPVHRFQAGRTVKISRSSEIPPESHFVRLNCITIHAVK
jgi:hypothetical protein